MSKLAYAGATACERAALQDDVKVVKPVSTAPKFPRRVYTLDVVNNHRGQLNQINRGYHAILVASLQYDYPNIMEQLGLRSLGTVKSRLNRAREALDKLIAETGETR